jgi:hypothetical protein
MEVYGRADVKTQGFLTSAMVGVVSLTALPPRKEPTVHIGYEAGWTPKPVWTTR